MVLNNNEAWRSIPPEEKLALMAIAQSRGFLAALIALIIAGTVAVGLQLKWIFWGALLASPAIYQFTASRVWRFLRPKTMLEYLAARTAARRYAYAVKAEYLNPTLVFRGHLEHLYDKEDVLDELSASIENIKETEVWIALFEDAIVCMSERAGGADLQFGHLINDKLKMTVSSSEYVSGKEIIFESSDPRRVEDNRVKITSKYPAAFVVFEKKVQQRMEMAEQLAITQLASPQAEA